MRALRLAAFVGMHDLVLSHSHSIPPQHFYKYIPKHNTSKGRTGYSHTKLLVKYKLHILGRNFTPHWFEVSL